MTASPYCACRTAALRIFVRSLVGPPPSSTIATTLSLTRAARPARAARAFSTSSSAALPTQWRTALRSDLRLGQATTAVRAIHTSQRCAAQASEAAENNTPVSKSIVETSPTDEPAPPPPVSSSAPTTLGKNKRKKLRRRREAEAQAELILKELDAHTTQPTQAHIRAQQASTEPTAGAAPDAGAPSTIGAAAAATPSAALTISDKRKQRKVLRASRRVVMKEAARKEELADQILSKKQRQARAKERAAKQLEKEASAKADEEAAAARAKRRKDKKLRGKAERLAVLAENDPGKYADIEAKRVKKEMKKERRAERLEKKRTLEQTSKNLRGIKANVKGKEKQTAKQKEKQKEKEDREREKTEPEAWMAQKQALKEKFPEGWKPRKKLSPDALEGIRALNRQLPETYTTAVLAQHFEISPEAVRRILKSKWQASPDVEEERQMRWFERGKQVWTRWAALGKKPPKQWQREGILRDASWTGSRKRAHEAREAYEDQQTRLAKLKAEQPHLLRGRSRRVYEREQAEQEGDAQGGAQEEPKREGVRDSRGGGRNSRGSARDRRGGGRGRGRGRDTRGSGHGSGQDQGDASFPSEW
ncbi:rrg9 chagb ame full required for respiratory growth protein mitochondrial flags precursor [Ophiostoma piceae UAMH 11346]|uniref:Required for respiratory growth protein 9, mitochondrial n=1 Tax=Ophiostoma piceae (strain UAMH 11346) TaxID=1262450 RepID=S3C691_OPHP1|nr:rrg9 chagb ame full required for respiratory growth protein mitochondrial flags precursor [Ophiostoma piceae UAMH 11346]